MSASTDLIARSAALFMSTYTRFPAVMVSGQGCRLTDADGREYLDFLAGIAVCSLGHCHPAITAAIHDATGVWIDEFPLTPERVLKALGKLN